MAVLVAAVGVVAAVSADRREVQGMDTRMKQAVSLPAQHAV